MQIGRHLVYRTQVKQARTNTVSSKYDPVDSIVIQSVKKEFQPLSAYFETLKDTWGCNIHLFFPRFPRLKIHSRSSDNIFLYNSLNSPLQKGNLVQAKSSRYTGTFQIKPPNRLLPINAVNLCGNTSQELSESNISEVIRER